MVEDYAFDSGSMERASIALMCPQNDCPEEDRTSLTLVPVIHQGVLFYQ
jgi:hypothetical protein